VISGLSMYRLISSSLVVLMLLAILFAALGLIGFTPEGIALTAVLAVVSTALVSLMSAQSTKSIAHLESSVITGLLIAFIVPPTLEARDLLGVTAAGALAGVSKYVLAYRGRHFLNPAATGVTIAGFLGLTAGFWWVANPPLTPFIVLTGVLIAWRSGLGLISLIALGVGVGALMVRLLLSGEELFLSLYLVATSYPIVFLALFMVSEPLTMAPRRLAQVLVALIVGLGTAWPPSVSVGSTTFYASPELVLLVANLVAFGATLTHRAARAADLTLSASEAFGEKGLRLRFSLGKPLRFAAGQWLELHFPHRASDRRGQRRVFSIVSAPHHALGESPFIEIATTITDRGSSFKHALSHAPVTSAARISNMGGDFLLPTDPHTPLVMIAGGIGITPFVSHLAHLKHTGQKRDVVVLEIRRPAATHPFEQVIQHAGVTHQVIAPEELDSALADPTLNLRSRRVMVSGSPRFIRGVSQQLRKLGVRKIHTDSFVGY